MSFELSKFPGLFVRRDNAGPDMGALEECYERDVYGIRSLKDVSFAIDVGAHIGGVSVLLHECFPSARIIAVECCPENIPCLDRNVGEFAEIVQAAVSYRTGELLLASTVYTHCRTTGSSVVTTREDWMNGTMRPTWDRSDYHLDERPLRKVTLEALIGDSMCDFLKLDCEGSEIDIFHNCTLLDKVRKIAGEFHSADFLTASPPHRRMEVCGSIFKIE